MGRADRDDMLHALLLVTEVRIAHRTTVAWREFHAEIDRETKDAERRRDSSTWNNDQVAADCRAAAGTLADKLWTERQGALESLTECEAITTRFGRRLGVYLTDDSCDTTDIRAALAALNDYLVTARQQLSTLLAEDRAALHSLARRAASAAAAGPAAAHWAVNLLTHALTRARHPAARSLLKLRLARSLAAAPAPAPQAARRALNAAEYDLHRAGGDRPAWCTWMSEADLAVDTGQTLLDLGDTRPAHQLLTQGEHLLPASRDKTRGIFLAYQATSHLAHHDTEPAAHAATHALELARRTHAPRCEQLVQRLTPALRPHAHHDAVAHFLHLATA